MSRPSIAALCTIAIASAVPGPALAQAAASAAAPAGRCAGLANDWRAIEIALARSSAEGIADDSAPRATMRAGQDTANYTKAGIVLRLMEANRCPLPSRAPSSTTFMLEAMECKTASMKASIPEIRAGIPACDLKTWKGIK